MWHFVVLHSNPPSLTPPPAAATHSVQGVSFAVENKNSRELEFTMDCSGSNCTNVVSHRGVGALRAVVRVPPRETKVVHYLVPDDTSKSWSWGYSSSWRWV
jgi:hypothetical protein